MPLKTILRRVPDVFGRFEYKCCPKRRERGFKGILRRNEVSCTGEWV